MDSADIEKLKAGWQRLTATMEDQFGDKPDLQIMLFLIGVQELGQGRQQFTKDQKQDLMHLGTCRILSQYGYYEYRGVDADGWPEYKLARNLPSMSLREQDQLLKKAVLDYFDKTDIT
jgi:hypothetical protein